MADEENLNENQRRTLANYTIPSTNSCGSSIVRLTVVANNFELKPSLIKLVQQDQFSGSPQGLVRQPTKHQFYRAWVTVKPVGSAKSCRLKVNSGYNDATLANGSEERTGEMLRVMRRCDGYVPKLRKG
ncbi:hypothetical protein PIB30_013351 [Stylosanthes scabra]|uniref:Uncharacterized protein n=1 Tax=Stylosanthes scabra TaxID=79078 RepID=A0ABU6U5R4_9FABA|nr:hypothetical protein [Stylosanthes scabra]